MFPFPPRFEVGPDTWLYLSTVLILTIFVRFNRVWSLRNVDLALLLAASAGLYVAKAGLGYTTILVVTAVLLIRLLLDPLLQRRPHLGPNLGSQGAVFLCIAAFGLIALEAFRESTDSPGVEPSAAAVTEADPETEPTEAEPEPGAAMSVLFDVFHAMFGSERQASTAIALVTHLLVMIGMLLVGRNLFGDAQLGLGMAMLYLLLPCTALGVSQVHHVLPSALTVWALVAYRRPMVSGLLLGLACGVMFFPVFLLPLWASYYGRRGALRFGAALLIVGAIVGGSIAFTVPGQDSFLRHTIGSIQLESLLFSPPGEPMGFWADHPASYRTPIIASFFLLLIGLTIWPRRKNLEHLLASSAAVIVATQFWYPVAGLVYLLWYLPLVLVVVFRPRLAHLQLNEPAGEMMAARSVGGPRTARSVPSAGHPHLYR